MICLGLLPVARASDSKLLYGIPNSKYYLELAKVHQRYGHFDEAIEMYGKAIVTETDDSEKNKLKIGLGRAYLHANRAEDAEKTILEAVETERDTEKKAEYYLYLAEVYETLNRVDKAIEAYEFVLGNCTDNINIHTARQKLTKLLKGNGTLKEYVSLLEKKLEEDPEDIMVMECLARAYSINETNNEKILPLYEKLFDAKPDDRQISSDLIRLFRQSGQYEKAVEVHLKLMESDPDSPKKIYYERISDLYLESGNPEEALIWDERSLAEDPDNAYTCLRVAERYAELKKEDKALEMYISAIAKTQREGDKELISLELVDFYIDLEDLEKAKNLATEVLNSSNDPQIKRELQTRIALIDERKKKESVENSGS